MTKPHRRGPSSESSGATDDDGGQRPPATPRWVKIAGIVLVLLVLAALVKVLVGGGLGEHGPGLHTGLGGTVAVTPVRAATLAGAAA